MLKYVIGIVFGILIYHYFPGEVRNFASKTGEIVHEGAQKAADMTRPQSAVDQLIERVR